MPIFHRYVKDADGNYECVPMDPILFDKEEHVMPAKEQVEKAIHWNVRCDLSKQSGTYVIYAPLATTYVNHVKQRNNMTQHILF